jgi:ADP-ribose pyrophosphatase YjhB (NUDIX family)
MEIDETTEQTALRECFEETGLTVELRDLWGVWSYYHASKRTSGVLVLYTAQVTGGEARGGSDSVEARFFGTDEIPFDQLAFETHRDALTRWRTRVQSSKSSVQP